MASGKSIEELEALCVELELKVRKVKDTLKEISKFMNQKIKEL
jgi:hypothetical protein